MMGNPRQAFKGRPGFFLTCTIFRLPFIGCHGRGGIDMEKMTLMILVMIGALILLIVCAVKGEMENILTFIMRGLLGGMAIHVANLCLAFWGISVGVGINVFTFLTIAFLGISGFLGLYALGFYQLL